MKNLFYVQLYGKNDAKTKEKDSEIHVFNILNRFFGFNFDSRFNEKENIIPQPARKEVNFLRFFLSRDLLFCVLFLGLLTAKAKKYLTKRYASR